jgi:Xaa-Pro aminopeptidase
MERIEKLQALLVERKVDCALMLYHRDVYYYAGTARPASLAVTPDSAVLFTRRGRGWIEKEAPVEDIRDGGLSSILEWARANGAKNGTIGIEMDLVPANTYVRLTEELPEADFTDISPLILEQRLVKDEGEVSAIKGACRIVEEAHRHLPNVLREGAAELDLAAEVERVARMHGHETFAILRKRMETEMGAALVLSGESLDIMGGYGQVVTGTGLSPAFPYGPSRRTIRAGEAVVFDIAAVNKGYHADMARTYCVGRAKPEVHEAHAALVAIQEAIREKAVPGATASSVYEAAVGKAGDLGVRDYFQGIGEQQGTFVGHGLGLEVDELPLLSPRDETIIQKNMTFTTEIFIVHPDFGEVKLEDTLRATENGPEFLTDMKREVIEV